MHGSAVGLDRVGDGLPVGVDDGDSAGVGVMLGLVLGRIGVSVGVEISSGAFA